MIFKLLDYLLGISYLLYGLLNLDARAIINVSVFVVILPLKKFDLFLYLSFNSI